MLVLLQNDISLIRLLYGPYDTVEVALICIKLVDMSIGSVADHIVQQE